MAVLSLFNEVRFLKFIFGDSSKERQVENGEAVRLVQSQACTHV